MPSPTLNGSTYYLRLRVPANLRQFYPASEKRISLRTKDPVTAKARFAEAYANLQPEFQGHLSEAVRLTDRQIVALAGVRYRRWIGIWGDDPGAMPESR